ncbi:hypothetical protein [Gallintestinimicrobium sp.]|uniref:hypothetical protein n=1 Tax=Gallintestinimicrobium sp. TaxID=2981655 RepID=UPI00399187F9
MTDSGLLTGLTHLVEGRTRSISPENFHGEKGKGGMATEGTGKNCARELGQGWKISPSVDIPGKGKLTAGRNRRERNYSAYLADLSARRLALVYPADVLGWRRSAVDRSAVGRFFLYGLV